MQKNERDILLLDLGKKLGTIKKKSFDEVSVHAKALEGPASPAPFSPKYEKLEPASPAMPAAPKGLETK